MAGGKNNTQRIEILESQAATLSARLDVFDTLVKSLTELLKKYSDATEGHSSKITLFEERIVVLGDLKEGLKVIAALEKELVAVKKDLETFQKWQEEQRQEKEETSRRWWSFGPSLTATIISGGIALLGIVVNIALALYFNRPK